MRLSVWYTLIHLNFIFIFHWISLFSFEHFAHRTPNTEHTGNSTCNLIAIDTIILQKNFYILCIHILSFATYFHVHSHFFPPFFNVKEVKRKTRTMNTIDFHFRWPFPSYSFSHAAAAAVVKVAQQHMHIHPPTHSLTTQHHLRKRPTFYRCSTRFTTLGEVIPLSM